jgi:uncharacterized protein YciI
MHKLETIARRAVLCLMLGAPLAQAQSTKAVQSPHAPAKAQHYLYVLRVAPQLQDDSKWTDKHKVAAGKHVERLQKATAEGKVILAGRTTEALDKTFGLVIFEADNEAAAKAFMEADPAVVAGVMTATLHPYAIALQRKQ